jgi:hypothetical protein
VLRVFVRRPECCRPRRDRLGWLITGGKHDGAAAAAYAGIDEQVCAETTLPTMTITTVVPDS